MRKIEKFKAALEALQELGEENLDPQNYVVDVMNWLEESIELSKPWERVIPRARA